MNETNYTKNSIWSVRVVTILSILFIPLAGAFLSAINYKRVGKTKRGAVLFFVCLLLILGFNFILSFFSSNIELNSFIAVIIVTFVIFFDQKRLYSEWKDSYPEAKPRPWWSALITVAIFDLFVFIILLIAGI